MCKSPLFKCLFAICLPYIVEQKAELEEPQIENSPDKQKLGEISMHECDVVNQLVS